MKNCFIIIGLFLIIVNSGFCYEKIYINSMPPYRNYYYRNNFYKPNYNPYKNYSYTNYKFYRINSSNKKRVRNIRNINRIRRYASNYLSWDILRNTKGALTGYSTPINEDIYQQLGIDSNYKNQKTPTPKTTTNLYSMPSKNNSRYSSIGKKDDNLGGVAGKTGVTIIYD